METSCTKTLRERGVRVTPQRAHVWRLLAGSGGHFPPEEIWERTRDELPGMELSTVYRILDALREAGLVVDSRLPEGPRVFEARASSRPHLVFERCGRVGHPEPEAAERLSRAAGRNLGGSGSRSCTWSPWGCAPAARGIDPQGNRRGGYACLCSTVGWRGSCTARQA
ncbi:hypothetical protein GBA65_21405 (plasmid) [Rubrobacter marinus]|uniref:Ferric uptake regulator, Fur family n=1 Tax=Rubrobacter marinus TaxID=2653852 RepID=A0A6G8Q3H2_9ACTN|nr:hypothetical protein GBA65_21405 [Rubrobacter marinus]